MGLLEKLLARLESVEAKLAQLDPSVLTGDAATSVSDTTNEAVVESVKPTPDVPATTATTPVASQDAPAVDVELGFDSSLTHKIPWDARIHSTSKKTNAKGDWKKLRGVNEMTFNQIEAELVAAAKSCDTSTGEVTTPTAPSVPSTPAAPTTPAAPSVPSVPSTPAPPTDTPRAKVNKEITELTQGYKVSHEDITEYVFKPRGVDTVDALTPEQLEEVAVELKGWADYLELIMQAADKYDELHEKSAEHGLDKVVTTFCQQHGAECTVPGMVPKPSLSKLYDDINQNLQQWVSFLGA